MPNTRLRTLLCSAKALLIHRRPRIQASQSSCTILLEENLAVSLIRSKREANAVINPINTNEKDETSVDSEGLEAALLEQARSLILKEVE